LQAALLLRAIVVSQTCLLFTQQVTPGGLGPPAVPSRVPRKPQDPFIFVPEDEGSVGILHRFGDGCHHVGHIRGAPSGRVTFSPTFEELPDQEYRLWRTQDSVEAAFRELVQEAMDPAHGVEPGRLRHLVNASKKIPSLSGKPAAALRFAARRAVIAAVANMLQVCSFEEITGAVRDALAAEVIES
jgi:hypothetical protein